MRIKKSLDKKKFIIFLIFIKNISMNIIKKDTKNKKRINIENNYKNYKFNSLYFNLL